MTFLHRALSALCIVSILAACAGKGVLPNNNGRFVAPSNAAIALAMSHSLTSIQQKMARWRSAAAGNIRPDTYTTSTLPLTNDDLVSILQHAIYDLNPDDDDLGGTVAPVFDNLQTFVNDYASGNPSQDTLDKLNRIMALTQQYAIDGGGRIVASAGIRPDNGATDYSQAAAWTAGVVTVIGCIALGVAAAPAVVAIGVAMAVAGVVVYTIAALNPNLPDNPEAASIADGMDTAGIFSAPALASIKSYTPATALGMTLYGGFLGWLKYKIGQYSHTHTYPWSTRWSEPDGNGGYNWRFFSNEAYDGYHQDCSEFGVCSRIQSTPPPSTPQPRNQPQ